MPQTLVETLKCRLRLQAHPGLLNHQRYHRAEHLARLAVPSCDGHPMWAAKARNRGPMAWGL